MDINDKAKLYLTEFLKYKKIEKQPVNEETIRVTRVAAVFSFFYEKIRQAVDYQEEHLLRRVATERILSRLFVTNHTDNETIAKNLIKELIWARYLKNETIPVSKIGEIAEVISKYKEVIKELDGKQREWVLSVASTEIEKRLVSFEKQDALINFAFEVLKDEILKADDGQDVSQKQLLLFLSLHRNLLKSDRAILRFHLLLYYFPTLLKTTEEERETLIKNIGDWIIKIEQIIDDPMGEKYDRYVKKQVVPFWILRDVLMEDNAEEIINDDQKFKEIVERICTDRYLHTREKLQRMVVRSVIYIFLTKMVFALLLEVPADKWIYHETNWINIAINTITPPFAMYVIASTVKVPGNNNTVKILEGLKRLVYEGKPPYAALYLYFKKKGLGHKIFTAVYFLTFFVTLGVILKLLSLLQFTPVSALIFIMFLSVVSFFGMQIRKRAIELDVTGPAEGILDPLLDIFSIPILRLGRLLSSEIIKINVFSFILDFIIEAPFKSVVDIFEQWVKFTREKKEEIV